MSYEVRKITTVGDSIGVTLPTEYLQELGLNKGDYVKIVLASNKIVIEKV